MIWWVGLGFVVGLGSMFSCDYKVKVACQCCIFSCLGMHIFIENSYTFVNHLLESLISNNLSFFFNSLV